MADTVNTKKYISLDRLSEYDVKIKALMDTKDEDAINAAKGYADSLATNYDTAGSAETAKQEAIAAVTALSEGAVATNAAAIAAINDAEGGILAQAKSFATAEDAKVQDAVDALAGKVGTVPEGSTVMGIITNIQENAYDDTALVERIDGIDEKVTTLVGEDANKSVRAIAAEELAAQLVADGAAEALDTLEEIAAWIQSHPDDAAAMNKAILALQNKLTLGTYVDGEETKEYATVKAYVEAAIAALNIGDYAVAADLTALAGRVTALETESAKHALKTEVQAVSDALTEYKDAHAGDYTNAQVDAAIKVVADNVAALNDTYASDEELAQAIADAKADASNKDAVVLAEAQKATAAVQTALDTHTGNGDIHVTAEQKTAWTTAAGKAHEHSNLTVLEGITAAKVTEWDKVSGKAEQTALQAEIERAMAAEKANTDAIAAFKECLQEDIEALFA